VQEKGKGEGGKERGEKGKRKGGDMGRLNIPLTA